VPTGQIVIKATLPPARFEPRQPQTHNIALNGRRVILAFDSDVMRKRQHQLSSHPQ
jgi:hypothetical protein